MIPLVSHIRTAWIQFALLAIAIVAGVLGQPVDAPAQTAQVSREPAIQAVSEAPKDVLNYWTKRRMRRAEPLDLEVREPALAESSTAAPGEREPLLHAPFSSHEVPNTTTYPNRTHGKVFFDIDGSSFVCSGTVVHAPAENVVLTAGHCVFDAGGTNQFVDNFLFVPAYKGGRRPFGSWPAETLATTSGWQNDGNLNFDIGVAVMDQMAGEEIEDAVGSRGIAFDQPRDQAYDAYGYPAAPPFTGQKLWVCESEYFGDDPYYEPPGPRPMGIGCDMTGGSSGGGWVIAGGYVASVNSFTYPTLPTELHHLYGPYFGAVAKGLYSSVDGTATEPSDLVPGRRPTAPQTTITAGPADGSTITDATPTFGFSSDETDSAFECRVDGGAFDPCSSPRQIGPLGDGAHSFAARATDSFANTEATPARRSFTVDTRISNPTVRARGTQAQGDERIRLKVRVGAAERALATAGGKINLGRRADYRFRRVTRTLEPSDISVLRLKPARKRDERRILRALERGKSARATISVRISDAVGNFAVERRFVKLK